LLSHLFHGNLTGARALVDDVLYKIRVASHISLFIETNLLILQYIIKLIPGEGDVDVPFFGPSAAFWVFFAVDGPFWGTSTALRQAPSSPLRVPVHFVDHYLQKRGVFAGTLLFFGPGPALGAKKLVLF
jgi:hypothetical protein